MRQRPPKYGYMDLTDFDHEVGEAAGGNTIYPSVDDLKEHNECWDGCGIVKVKVELAEVIKESDWKKDAMSAEECEKYEGSSEQLAHYKRKEKKYQRYVTIYKNLQKKWQDKK